MRKIIIQKWCVFALIMVLVGVCCAQGITATWNEMAGTNEMDNGEGKQYYKYGNYRDDGVLLITDSTSDIVCMFDPYDGTYLGDFCNIPPIHGTYLTPVNAIPGPDGNIYVSDQVQDAVFVFNSTGTFLYEYANDTDGLNNVRGIAFRGTHLFVTSGDDYVAEFDGPHNRLPDFINDGSEPFDIFFLDDGRALLSDIGSTDNVRLYYANGTLDAVLFQISFPQQIMNDTVLPGSYLNAGFSGGQITDFDLDGTIVQTTPFSSGRGVYRLGNGNLLVTDSDGVWEISPGTGSIIGQKKGGSSHFIEYYGPTQEGYTLTIIIEGNGTVTKNPDQAIYPPDTPVELTAIPGTDWIFSYWSGDLTGDTNPETITMTENKTITAHFIPSAATISLDLYMGWNMVTVPLGNHWTAETLGQNISGCTTVCWFNASSQTYVTHVMGIPYNEFPIQDGVGYFVYVTSDSYLNVTGIAIASVNIFLDIPWNLIGWYKETATIASSLGAALHDCTTICMYNATTGSYTTHVVGIPYNDFPITQGMGLFIYATSTSYWTGEG